jgi:hypothetical protein
MQQTKNRSPADWAELANNLFLSYVRERLSRAPMAWGAWGPTRPDIPTRHTGIGLRNSPQAEATRIAVALKNQFVATMAAMPEMPGPAEVRDLWLNTMRRAESEIAERLALLRRP